MDELRKKIDSLLKSSISITDRLCVKKYLTTKEKFKFIDEYNDLLTEHINDYKGYESYIAFVFFNLLIAKYYSSLELVLNYEEFDILQERGVFESIREAIGDDYNLLLNVANIPKMK